MRVVVANKFWYRRAGLERVMIDEVEWLEGAGHETAHFSMAHPDNDPSPWERFFVPYLELGQHGQLSAGQRALAAARMFHNIEAARRFDALLQEFRPDIIHIHGIHRQISPSILRVAHARQVPVVQTLHDYHHVCPSDVLLSGGKPCHPRRCGTYWYGQAIARRCVRGSTVSSVLSAAETSLARVTKTYEKAVRRFISPSRFLADEMLGGGWTIPIDLVRNAVPVGAHRGAVGDGLAIIGRLRDEKGVEVALEAARRAKVDITVAGDGPMREALRRDFPEARFLGHISGEEVTRLLRRTRAVVVPSLCFENASMSILEAMAEGVPVLASRIGGIPEQIADGVSGLLAPPGDVDALASAMRTVDSSPELALRLGAEAQRKVRHDFSPERHLSGLLESYTLALAE